MRLIQIVPVLLALNLISQYSSAQKQLSSKNAIVRFVAKDDKDIDAVN